jgi:hypothetical protein
MAEPIQCEGCRRPYSAEMGKCPFCGVARPVPKERRLPLRCATCARLYSPDLADCPFCAKGSELPAAKAELPAPPPIDDSDAVTVSTGAWVLIGAAVVFVVSAVFVSRVFGKDESETFRWCSYIGVPLGLGLLVAVARSAAIEAAKAFGGMFYMWRIRPIGESLVRFVALLPWLLSSVVCTCTLYTGAIVVSRLTASAPVKAVCRAEYGTDPVYYNCKTALGQGFRLRVAQSDAKGGVALELDARDGAFGIWFADASKATVAGSPREPGVGGEPAILFGPRRSVPIPARPTQAF